jgi:hypothetical protein
LQAIRGIEALPISPPAGTCAELRFIAVIGLNLGYNPILNIYLEYAPATAIMRAGSYYCSLF